MKFRDRKRRLDALEDHRKRFKKTERIKKQNEEWVRLENEGGKVKEWYRKTRKKKKKKSNQNKRNPR